MVAHKVHLAELMMPIWRTSAMPVRGKGLPVRAFAATTPTRSLTPISAMFRQAPDQPELQIAVHRVGVDTTIGEQRPVIPPPWILIAIHNRRELWELPLRWRHQLCGAHFIENCFGPLSAQ